jgi:hypothetical protein
MKPVFTDSKGRPVCDIEVQGTECDAFVARAYYDDDLEPFIVPPDELDFLTEAYPEYVAEQAFENAVMSAESLYEGDR